MDDDAEGDDAMSSILDVNDVVQNQLAKGIQDAVNGMGGADMGAIDGEGMGMEAMEGMHAIDPGLGGGGGGPAPGGDPPHALAQDAPDGLAHGAPHDLDEFLNDISFESTKDPRLDVFMRQVSRQMAAMQKRIDELELKVAAGNGYEDMLLDSNSVLKHFLEGDAAPALKRRRDARDVRGEKKRKPQLSKIVRATMFRLLGMADVACGYVPSPALPDYAPATDAEGARLWRWEWDKTIKQSENNTAFVEAIQSEILRDRQLGLHAGVPEEDWPFLAEAIESAYTNLRREKEAQQDPVKMQKKEEHRRKIRKRALKDEKLRRRQKVFAEQRAKIRAHEEDSHWIDFMAEQNVLSLCTDKELEEALDLRYMSSEDELEDASRGERVFSVHRPAWRSQKLTAAFQQLDGLKPLERAIKRVVGKPRNQPPPLDTPEWMLER